MLRLDRMNIEGDRRCHPRLPFSQPCKIHDLHTGKYIGGCTQDISSGGALVQVPHLLGLKPGDIVHVGVAIKRRQGLLRTAEMMKAAVTRAVQTVDDCTLLGLRFEEVQEMQPTASLRVAA